MNYAKRYRCSYCGLDKFLPERPLNPTRSVNTGCERCENITPHKPV